MKERTKDFLLVIRMTALGCESASLTNYLKLPLRLGLTCRAYGQSHSRQSDHVISGGPIFAQIHCNTSQNKSVERPNAQSNPTPRCLDKHQRHPHNGHHLYSALDYHFLSPAHHKSTRIQLFPSHVSGHLGCLVEKCSKGFQLLKVQSYKKKLNKIRVSSQV